MAFLRPGRNQLARGLFAFALAVLAGATLSPDMPARAQSADPATPAASWDFSRIISMYVQGSEPEGTFGGVPYVRTWGTVSGIVSPRESIVGFEKLAHDAAGNYPYQSEFEIIAPEKPGTNSVILIEPENRGNPVFLNEVHGTSIKGAPSANPDGEPAGNGFLFQHATSYARIQWQTGIDHSVPKEAEGVGEVIVRDFARLLEGRTRLDVAPRVDPGAYQTTILGGISLSGFFIDTFIAEGFNADPYDGRAVFQGAIAVDGTGNWLALNSLAAQAGVDEFPYVVPDAKPLKATELLGKYTNDPYYIDIANYTDFYRLRASVTDVKPENPRMRRYDWPSAHAPAPIDQRGGAIAARLSHCNGGKPLDLNPVQHAPYLRAVTLELEHELGVPSARQVAGLPPSSLFDLWPAGQKTQGFNNLPGVRLAVPLADDNGEPSGGVRFPDAQYPVGKAIPPAVPPVTTASISETCGNLGGWEQFSPEELARRYGNVSNYLKLYGEAVDRLIAQGYLLASDRDEMLKTAAAMYNRRPAD